MTELSVYNAADYLENEEQCAEYLNALMSDEDTTPEIISDALNDIANSRAMRGRLGEHIRIDPSLTLEALMNVLQSLGISMTFRRCRQN